MNRPVHFEIHADDPERAAKFYTAVFGWNIKKWDSPAMEYWVVMTGKEGEPGINGGLIRRKGPKPEKGQPVSAYVCTMEVASLDETMKKAGELGAAVALPKFAIPGLAWQAYMIDAEGNIFGIHQPDTNAK